MGPKKERDTIRAEKGLKEPSKISEQPVDQITIQLKILEIYNLQNDNRENLINVTFMDEQLMCDGEIQFSDCACRPESNPISTWTLTLNNVNSETIMDLSSQPLIITISKMQNSGARTVDVTSDKRAKPTILILLETIAYAWVDLIDLISNEVIVINSKAEAHSPHTPQGQYIKTYPHMPYIKYSLTSSKPLVEKKQGMNDVHPDETCELNTATITTEFIMHPTETMFEDNNEFEVNISLPLEDGLMKVISFKHGYRCKFSEMPAFKVRHGVSHLQGDAKFSVVPTSNELDFTDLVIPSDCHLPAHLVRNYSQLICLNEVYRFKQFASNLKYMTEADTIPIEVVCKQGTRILRFIGSMDLRVFGYAGKSRNRIAVPLIQVEEVSYGRKSIGKSTKSPKSGKQSKGNVKEKSKEVESQHPDAELDEEVKPPYAICEDGYNTCLILGLEIDRPLIALKTDVMQFDEIRTVDSAIFNESGVPMLDKQALKTVFRSQILKFATHPNLKSYHKCKQRESYPMNDIWAIAENDLFGSTALLIANKYNFNQPMDEDELEAMLRNSYVYLINKTYDILNDEDRVATHMDDLVQFRLQCAEECRELGYETAKNFHIMNLKDTSMSARCLLEYAVFNLRTGDYDKAYECVAIAVEKEPAMYDCYLLQAYVYFTMKDQKNCESTLQRLTKVCPNYFEAWMGLYLLYADRPDSPELALAQAGIDNALTFPYIGQLHKIESIFWQAEQNPNMFIRAIGCYITWGCLEFAELALAFSICPLGANSYHYLVHKALISYARGRYQEALQTLTLVNTNCSCKLTKVKRLRALCYLNMDNHGVTMLMDVLGANFCESRSYTPRCNLVNLKMGKYLLGSGKTRAGRYYLKKCCKKTGSYASLVELGNASVKSRSFEAAIRCFKLAHKINPYDWYPWSQLAIVYFRSGLPDQYRICAKNARENKITDEILSRELDKIDKTLDLQQDF